MNALSFCPRSPRRQAPRALRERLECSEGGDTGRRTRGSYRSWRFKRRHGRPFSPPPGLERKGPLYARRARKDKPIETRLWTVGGGLGGPRDQLGEPYRQLDPF